MKFFIDVDTHFELTSNEDATEFTVIALPDDQVVKNLDLTEIKIPELQ